MKINFKQSLVYYDGELVFLAADDNDNEYICLLVEDSATKTTYLVIQLSPDELNNYLNRKITLLDVIQNRQYKIWYLTENIEDYSFLNVTLIPQTGSIPENMLPLEGCFLPYEYKTVS